MYVMRWLQDFLMTTLVEYVSLAFRYIGSLGRIKNNGIGGLRVSESI